MPPPRRSARRLALCLGRDRSHSAEPGAVRAEEARSALTAYTKLGSAALIADSAPPSSAPDKPFSPK